MGVNEWLKRTAWAWGGLPAMVACGGAAVDAEDGAPGFEVEPALPSADLFQEQMDELTRALVERDGPAFEDMLSNEVHSRSEERGIDLDVLLEKQRGALINTFALEQGEIPVLEVLDAVVEGDAVKVTLGAKGEELDKPFYFVREDGAYRLNIAPPGFSKSAPAGALFGKSNYTIKNVNISGNENFTMSCYQGTNTVIAPQATRKMSCGDACGFWAGSIFANAYAYDGPQKYCDWNAWGADVIINLLSAGGFYCADYC